MTKWNITIQKILNPFVEVECARCGTDFKVARGQAEVRKIHFCEGCVEKVIKKYKRKREVRRKGQNDPYPKPIFA